MEELRAKHSAASIAAEAKEIMENYKTLVVGTSIRQIAIGCWFKCGGKPHFPIMNIPKELDEWNSICFGDCVNINFEDGPYLRQLGPIPEGKIPKKFLWPTSLDLRVPIEKEDGDDDDDEGDDDDDDDE